METRAERIKRERGTRSHEEIALKLTAKLGRKIGKGTVWKWEQVDEPNIDLEVFFALADVLRADPRQLATGEPMRKSDVAPNMLDLIHEYSRIDMEIRAPIRTLITKLYEQTIDKPTPRKARNKNEKRARELQAE